MVSAAAAAAALSSENIGIFFPLGQPAASETFKYLSKMGILYSKIQVFKGRVSGKI